MNSKQSWRQMQRAKVQLVLFRVRHSQIHWAEPYLQSSLFLLLLLLGGGVLLVQPYSKSDYSFMYEKESGRRKHHNTTEIINETLAVPNKS